MPPPSIQYSPKYMHNTMSTSPSIPTSHPRSSPPLYDSIKPHDSEIMRGYSLAKPHDSPHTLEVAKSPAEKMAENANGVKNQFLKLSQTPHAIRYQLFASIIKAASHYRASLDDMENLMLSSTRVLDNEITLLRAHGTITCLVGSRNTGWDLKVQYSHSTSNTRDPSGLHALHSALDIVAQENASVTEAIEELNEIVDAQPPEFHMIRNPVGHLYAAAFLSIAVHAILALLSRGSMLGAYISAIGAMVISIAHIVLRRHNPSYARFLELSVILMTGLTAHDPHITDMGAATLVSALPGYMYICDYVKHDHEDFSTALAKTAFWVAYAILLGLGLHILLDVVLVYKLFTLVVLVQDTVRNSRSRRSTNALGPQK